MNWDASVVNVISSCSLDASDELSLEEIPLSLDLVLDILASTRRRTLLDYLWDQPDNVGSFDRETKYIIARLWETGYTAESRRYSGRLQHHQIPKMVDAGIIKFDARGQTICYHKNEQLETAYERVHELDCSPSALYRSLSHRLFQYRRG